MLSHFAALLHKTHCNTAELQNEIDSTYTPTPLDPTKPCNNPLKPLSLSLEAQPTQFDIRPGPSYSILKSGPAHPGS